MKDLQEKQRCVRGCWWLGAAVGLAVFLMLWLIASWGFIGSLIFGALIGAVAGWLFARIFCAEIDQTGAFGGAAQHEGRGGAASVAAGGTAAASAGAASATSQHEAGAVASGRVTAPNHEMAGKDAADAPPEQDADSAASSLLSGMQEADEGQNASDGGIVDQVKDAAASAAETVTEAGAAAAVATADAVDAATETASEAVSDARDTLESKTVESAGDDSASGQSDGATAAGTAGGAAAFSGIKPSKELKGEQELAQRKGTYKYVAPQPEASEVALDHEAPAGAGAGSAGTKPARANGGVTGAVDAALAEQAAGTAVEEKQPETLTAAREGGADDLKLISGVGPKLEGVLNELGFYHFDQVAAWGPAEISWVDSRIPFKGRIERDGWVDQAKILAAGGETEFSARKKES